MASKKPKSVQSKKITSISDAVINDRLSKRPLEVEKEITIISRVDEDEPVEKPVKKLKEEPKDKPKKTVKNKQKKIAVKEATLKQETDLIKKTEPELSAHDIEIALASPAEENLSDGELDEIDKIIAEVEEKFEKNDGSSKGAEKAKKADKSEAQKAKKKKSVKVSADEKNEKVDVKISKKESPENIGRSSTATKKSSSNKSNKSKKAPKRALPYRILSRVIAVLTACSIIALLIRVATTNILPAKFFWPAVGVASLLALLYLFKAFRKKTHLIVITIFNLIGLAIIAASALAFLKINETMTFLDNNLGEKKEYIVYNVFVKKDSEYNSLSDINGQTLHSVSDFTDTKALEKAVLEQADASVQYELTVTTIMKAATTKDDYIGLLNSGTYEAALDYSAVIEGEPAAKRQPNRGYEKDLKIIGEIKVDASTEQPVISDSDITKDSFLVFISGIDTRSGTMVANSLSDVNIVMAVNPKTRNILLVAIPRDYYVQLHGTAGLPDKLTHAGVLGGLSLSMSTIEELLDIKFDHFLRVNFNAVINLVNAIGGITVYSDVDYDITAWTNHSCVFHPGYNDLKGSCALAFARERYAYETGDRHRGENQEQVIEKIFDKLTHSTTLISKYSDILNALSGSFETSLTTSDITSMVNMQLDDMTRPWTINTYNLDGTTGAALTYSYPGQYLSVMFPDMSTVETAKQKIQEVLSGASSSQQHSPSNTITSMIKSNTQ